MIFTPVLSSSLKTSNFICIDRNVNFPVSDLKDPTFQIFRFLNHAQCIKLMYFYMNIGFYIFLHIVVY